MSTEDREQSIEDFKRDLEQGLEEHAKEKRREADGEDAPYGACWRDIFVACTPACNAFIHADQDEQGRVRQHGDRCELIVVRRVTASALVSIAQSLGASRKATVPTAFDGPPPPPRPGDKT